MPKYVAVTGGTQQPSDGSRRVTVIHREPFSFSVSSTANEAITFLVLIQLPVLLLGDPVRVPDPLRPSRSRALPALDPVVSSAPGAGVRRFALGLDPLVQAVDASLALGGDVRRRVTSARARHNTATAIKATLHRTKLIDSHIAFVW